MRRVVHCVVAAAILGAPFCGVPIAAGAAHAAPPPGSAPAVDRGSPVCTIRDERLDEISGFAATGAGYVAVNDGTDVASHRKIFMLDRRCAVTRAVSYPSLPRDPEDLAVAPDGTIWVADIGDNGRSRETVALWRLARDARTPVIYRLRYPDRAHDAEALVLAGDGTPVIVTKDPFTAGLYVPEGPLRAGRTGSLTRVGGFSVPGTRTSNPYGAPGRFVITGGATAPDGDRVVLRTYADAFEFDVSDGDVVAAITKGRPRTVALPDEPQGESITYSVDGASLLTVSETAGAPAGTEPTILRYPASAGDTPPTAVPTGRSPGTAPRATTADSGRRAGLGVAAAVTVGVLLLIAYGRRVRRRGR